MLEIKRPEPLTKRPASAKKVFSGVIFDVYQWEQELYNGTKVTFEVLKRTDTVGVIPVTPEGKIVISRQQQPGKKPFYGLLGGRMDEGETPLEAAKRELREESGMVAKSWELLRAEHVTSKIDWVVYTLIARECELEGQQELDGGEKIELIECNWEEFLQYMTSPECIDRELVVYFQRALLNPELLAQCRKLILGPSA